MSINIDENGTISLYQGDSGEITVSGLDNRRNYTVFFAIQDKNRNLIGNELQTFSNKNDMVVFLLTSDYTNLLKVPKNKAYEIFTYGIKVVENNSKSQDTLFVSNSTYGDINRIIVYPQKVKGSEV
jgi:hypothetical protein